MTRDERLFLVLRIAAAMCFIGHGAFGIITKPGWLAYFRRRGDRPGRALALVWKLGTELLFPLSGDSPA